ncbi:hypothetical protein QZM46_05995 [Burkholderia vietnamiensis]|uniref:Uncharacterized protein n=3 Tax=Pseudomonadota TaxID=1224 RepID=A0ABS1AVV9_BURVI|nr:MULTISPECIES: hypothetical protein [Burkholderia]AJY07279.1 hypothetical protein AK36_1268 [Burkholderia vietnamiensis LMG 10929]AOJ76042.1 hypothetical protein WJ35_13885 [Burkholderia ubonensis]AOK10990.1 hypothetical protein WK31_12480 [Burkholderia vietnamiensis]AOK41820.1 hypothetical protein WL96_12600 [Burkholderia vietnamiensis]AVR16518.1 hypothetical protein A8H33_24625 [Burkholderia vietnamiensis]
MADGQPDKNVLGTGSGMLTPTGYKDRPKVAINICDKYAPPAADSIVGTCPFYYQPLHGEYWETVEKVSKSSAWETVKKFATSWDPWKDKEVARRLLHRREKLIELKSTDSDWSRHGNFMMRHIGCGHKPPDYYVSYGYYYCSDYGKNLYPTLTAQGKKWLENARWWLQRYIEIGLQQNMQGDQIAFKSAKPGNGELSMQVERYELELENNGDTFKTFAFVTHPLAYLDGGLAGLPVADLTKIGMRPNLQEWGDGRTLKQAWDAGIPVAKQKAHDWSSEAADQAREWGSDVARKAREWSSDTSDEVSRALERLLNK